MFGKLTGFKRVSFYYDFFIRNSVKSFVYSKIPGNETVFSRFCEVCSNTFVRNLDKITISDNKFIEKNE